jgi:hypothetical protein
MNHPALSLACLVSLTAATAAAVETNLQKGPADFLLGFELLSKQYDQGYVRNNNLTAHATMTARYWDIGVHLDGFMALAPDIYRTPTTTSIGTTTELSGGVDYLAQMPGYFQIIPHYQYIMYPDLPNSRVKDDQHWFGVDGWWVLPLPIPGFELGGGADYNPFYNYQTDSYRGYGGLSSHLFRAAVGMRQFYQPVPIDLCFWEILNFGNSNYIQYFGSGSDNNAGPTTLDLGVKYTQPFFFDQSFLFIKLESHFWVEKPDREYLHSIGKDPNDIVMSVGVEWMPD